MRIALTPGEPSGIGPDLILQLASTGLNKDVVVFADRNMLQQRAKILGLQVNIENYNLDDSLSNSSKSLVVKHIPTNAKSYPGKLDVANSNYVMETLRVATKSCLDREFDALVTGPIHKGIINEAGIPCSGHTEFLANYTNTSQVVMLLAVNNFRVALVSTHLPLHKVPSYISNERLSSVLNVLHNSLQQQFAIDNPKIAVCGLNPHAGEGGYLGTEEIETIIPVMKDMQAQGMNLIGPLPADTAFTPSIIEQADVILAMYHDQGLPVLKHVGFGEAVNVTLGLPIIRTSVDHGTALNLAGTGKADTGSLFAAIEMAKTMVNKQYEKA